MAEQMKDPGDEPFLKVLRPLVETYRVIMRKDARNIRTLDLTQAQFDVIITLGDTSGLPCKQITQETLLTKGTLTGVLDRLSAKGLIERVSSDEDRRSTIIRLTDRGMECFKRVFPAHIYYMKPFFENSLSPSDMHTLRTLLLKLKKSFETEEKQ